MTQYSLLVGGGERYTGVFILRNLLSTQPQDTKLKLLRSLILFWSEFGKSYLPRVRSGGTKL